jgi:DNA replication protein DnaC
LCDQQAEQVYGASGGLCHWRRFQGQSLASLDWRCLGIPLSQSVAGYVERLPQHLQAGQGLLLFGGVGSGKSHLAVGVGLVAVAHGLSVYAVSVSELLQQVRSSFESNQPGREARLMQQLTEGDLLILDDVDQTRPTPWASDLLNHIANQRGLGQRATLLTSHAHPTQLEAIWGQPIFSRLTDNTLFLSLAHVANYRQRQATTWPGTDVQVVVAEGEQRQAG